MLAHDGIDRKWSERNWLAMLNLARDYSLTGADAKAAVEKGLASAQWYRCDISRKRLKELMQRKDGPAIRDTLIWLAALFGSGLCGYATWGTFWCVPFFAVYGLLWGSASDSRWHECGHGTAFRTRWMNDAVYQLASFMIMREPEIWRWSHARHHTDTAIVGRDPEIVATRPPDLPTILLNLFAIKSAPAAMAKMALHATGRLTRDEATFVPESEHAKVFRTARIWSVIYALVIGAALYSGSLMPLVYVGLPTLYGGWLSHLFGLTQHAGLAEDVTDHRLNARTVYMNPVFRFLYWNMNYHIEHHMFPMVPYHALPALHRDMLADMPKPAASTIDAYREIVPALLRQLKDRAWMPPRPLPATAKPYRPGGHASVALAAA